MKWIWPTCLRSCEAQGYKQQDLSINDNYWMEATGKPGPFGKPNNHINGGTEGQEVRQDRSVLKKVLFRGGGPSEKFKCNVYLGHKLLWRITNYICKQSNNLFGKTGKKKLTT